MLEGKWRTDETNTAAAAARVSLRKLKALDLVRKVEFLRTSRSNSPYPQSA
jgi:hypothetical protein